MRYVNYVLWPTRKRLRSSIPAFRKCLTNWQRPTLFTRIRLPTSNQAFHARSTRWLNLTIHILESRDLTGCGFICHIHRIHSVTFILSNPHFRIPVKRQFVLHNEEHTDTNPYDQKPQNKPSNNMVGDMAQNMYFIPLFYHFLG